MALLRAEDQETNSATGERDNALVFIPSGASGVRATLGAMVRLTKIYRATIPIRETAERVTAGVREKDTFGEVAAIQRWVRDTVRYVRDVYDVETLKTPLETLRTLAGDCDDKSLLAGTLLQAIGYKVRYVAVGFSAPEEFEHVYVEVMLGAHWLPVETTEPVEFGWEPPQPVSRMVANV